MHAAWGLSDHNQPATLANLPSTVWTKKACALYWNARECRWPWLILVTEPLGRMYRVKQGEPQQLRQLQSAPRYTPLHHYCGEPLSPAQLIIEHSRLPWKSARWMYPGVWTSGLTTGVLTWASLWHTSSSLDTAAWCRDGDYRKPGCC